MKIRKKNTKKNVGQKFNPIQFRKPIIALILSCEGDNKDDEDTKQCARAIADSLRRQGHVVKETTVTKKNWKKSTNIQADVVFNLVEDSGWDLYMKVGCRLETLGRAQVGHDLHAFQYVISKPFIKRKLLKNNLSTPKSVIVSKKTNLEKLKDLNFPLIVKPANEHAGIGISQKSVVKDKEALKKQIKETFNAFKGDVVVEEFIAGKEMHVTIMGNDSDIHVLPFCEIGFKGKFKDKWGIYSYNAKWNKRSWEYQDARVHSPAIVPVSLEKKIKTLALKTYQTFGCRDIARVDVRIDKKGNPYIVDLNISPSLNYYDSEDATLASVYAMGWSYDQFIETVACITYKRAHGQ